MKKYVYIGIALLVILLSVGLVMAIRSNRSVEEKWKKASENVKAYSELFSSYDSKNRAFKLTVEQLEYTNDSIMRELNATRKELKVRDSRLQSMQYVSSSFTKADTITLVDTLFKGSEVNVDTLLSDEWYSMRVGLRYPSTIAVQPEFRSVKNIVVSSRKETVNPPKKFFLFRWFQKKHYVLNIDVVEKNPYVKEQNNRYVEIIR